MIHGLALCAGAGGLELGLRVALGDAYRTVGYVERDAYAAALLVARMADAALDPAPVWDDLETFDGRLWRDRVDLVSAGFPCQPLSHAGRRRGLGDERWLWPAIVRVLAAVAPGLVFLENVPGLLTAGRGAAFEAVVEDLAALGLDAEWDCFSAAEVGAPHRRERLFLLAFAAGEPQRHPRWRAAGRGAADAGGPGSALADAGGGGRRQGAGALRGGNPSLGMAAALWGTPRATTNRGVGQPRAQHRSRLEDQAALWGSRLPRTA